MNTIIYTDGACSRNGYPNAKAGYGIYINDNSNIHPGLKISQRVKSDTLQTNNTAELLGIIEAIKVCLNHPQFTETNITIYTYSKYSILMANKTTFDKKTKNIELVKELSGYIQKYKNISLIHIYSHTGNRDIHSLGNHEADTLASMSIDKNLQVQVQSKVYLNVPYSDKENAKNLGAKWDPFKKKWFCSNNCNELINKYPIN
jgi:ribonuclease HI